jgi:hypothetical protein
MTPAWLEALPVDPLPTLLAWEDQALGYWVRRDLLGETGGPLESLWENSRATALVRVQQADGSWRYHGKSYDPETGTHYDLLETYRNLRVLVEMYGFHRGHPAPDSAAEYVLSYQTEEGDIRGILGNQYMPYYHGAMLELLIKAGYGDDARVEAGLEWLLSMRQSDGGWIVPAQGIPPKERGSGFWLGAAILPDRSRPHAHLATGMVLRAFAAHPAYRRRPEVIAAGEALKNRLFRADKYHDRRAASYWLKFQYPFWWTSLLTALDTLSWLGFGRHEAKIVEGLDWLLTHQGPDGLWETGYGAGKRAPENRCWVGLAVCRVLKGFLSKVSPVS